MIDSPDYRMKWIRIWPHAWFDSSMRVELTNEERAFWVDILALAGKARTPGTICSGVDDDGLIGYPLVLLSSLLVSWTPDQTERILEKLKKTKRVRITKRPLLSGEDGLIIEIVTWKKWQSEAQRVQKYRNTARSVKRNTPTSCTDGRTEVEVDGEVEGEVEKKETPKARFALPDWVPCVAWEGFMEMRQGLKPKPTDRAKELLIAKLGRLVASGGDAEEILNQSTENGWKGLFPVQRANGRENSKAVAKQQRSEAALDTVLGGDAPVSTPSVRRLPPGTD